MGHRANLITLRNGKCSVFYSHWCALTIPSDLFWGPSYAMDFVGVQRQVDDWLDGDWAEGGAVIDLDTRVLLLYGGEEIKFDVPLRRTYLAMLRRVWRGWEVRWANEGIADLADYVGHPRDKVLSSTKDKDVQSCSLVAPYQQDWTSVVGGFRLLDGELRLFPLAGDVDFYLGSGPCIVEESGRSTSLTAVPLDEWIKDDFPIGGFHVDVSAGKLDYWTAPDVPGIPARIASMWPGWVVTWHRDAYEFQQEITAGRIRFPARSTELMQRQIADLLLRDDRTNHIDSLLNAATTLVPDGVANVEINPWALREDRVHLDIRERRRILALALNMAETGNGMGPDV